MKGIGCLDALFLEEIQMILLVLLFWIMQWLKFLPLVVEGGDRDEMLRAFREVVVDLGRWRRDDP